MNADAAVLAIDETRAELQGFRSYYQKEIEPWMAEQKDKQKGAWRWALMVGIPSLVGFPIAIWLFFFVLSWETWAFIIIALYVVGLGALTIWPLNKLKGEIKSFLVTKVCGFFNFDYSETASGSGFDQFEKSGLLPGYDRRDLEDEIKGEHSGVPFDLVECKLEDERRDSKGRTTYVQIYHGVLFRFNFPKDFEGQTLVVKDSGKIGNFFKGMKKKGERINLEDPRFEKQFEVWGTDQIEARYLLTPTFMERVVELASSMGEKRVELCFNGNRLLVSVHVSKNQFEGGSIFTSVTDKRRVEELVNEICKIFDIIDTLKLTLQSKI
jgi:hypothetical protein